ncbi:MAG: alpha/beta fold hydrolase [Geminicoccaceae bacterium]
MSYHLADFGSYTVGGCLHEVTEGAPRRISFTRDAEYDYDPRGTFAVEHAYVQYFIPEARRAGPPVVLVHGGGMHGSTWETTPDGRPGWLHLLLRDGFEVHVIDNVERDRAGFAPGVFEGEPILRSLEEAWSLFRIGPPEGFAARAAFRDQAFPVSAFETLGRYLVPRWLTTTPLQSAALIALLERTGRAVVVCHSQSGEITFDAAERRPDLFDAILAVEPSATPCDLAAYRHIPIVLMIGDHLDMDARWQGRLERWQTVTTALAAAGADCRLLDTAKEIRPGGSHMLMMDSHSERCLAEAWRRLDASR